MNRLTTWIRKQVMPLISELQARQVMTEARLEVAEKEIEALKAKLGTIDVLSVIASQQPPKQKQTPFRIQSEPFRKRRAVLEQSTDPEYQRAQQMLRDEKAKQPIGAS